MNYVRKGALALAALVGSYMPVAAQEATPKPDITISGDARLRYQGFRNRFNPTLYDLDVGDMRARLGISYNPEETITLNARGVIETATEDAIDPRLHDGIETTIDRAFLEYVDGPFKLNIGEYDNPFKKQIWMDKDRPLEGASISYSLEDSLGANTIAATGMAHFGNHIIDWSNTAMYGLKIDSSFDNLTASASYIHFDDLDENFIGSNAKQNGKYKNDFRVASLSANWKTKICDIPISISGWYGHNLAADDNNQMYEGKIAVIPTKSLTVFGGYRAIEQDAIVASFTPKDTPGTNFEGPFGGVAYKFTKKVSGSLFIANPRLIDVPFDDQRQIVIFAGLEIKY